MTSSAGVVRDAYLAAAAVAVDLLGHPAVEPAWTGTSVCAEWDVGGLAAHLSRAMTQVEYYLDRPSVPADPATLVRAGEYYAAFEGIDDPASNLSMAVRDRSAALAARGPAAVHEAAAASLAGLRARLPTVSPDSVVVALDIPMLVDEYLRTRMVEVCVHLEDLAMSLDLPVPELPAEAVRTAVDVLVDTAVTRHGAHAVLRALARRERDTVDALRVL